MNKNNHFESGKSEGIIMKELEIGTIGKIFGSGNNISRNIAGICVILLTLTIIGILILKFGEPSTIETLAIITPIVTLIFGFLFGSIVHINK